MSFRTTYFDALILSLVGLGILAFVFAFAIGALLGLHDQAGQIATVVAARQTQIAAIMQLQ